MPAFGLAVMSVGAVLLYTAVKDIAVGDFFRGLVSGTPGKPRVWTPPGLTGPVGTPGTKTPGDTMPPGPTGPQGHTNLAPIPPSQTTGGLQQIQARWLPVVAGIVAAFGVKVSSAYRTTSHNSEVGGAPNSDHLTGNAVDFVGPPAAMRKLYDWAIKRGFPYVEPWSQTGGSHVHISFARSK